MLGTMLMIMGCILLVFGIGFLVPTAFEPETTNERLQRKTFRFQMISAGFFLSGGVLMVIALHLMGVN